MTYIYLFKSITSIPVNFLILSTGNNLRITSKGFLEIYFSSSRKIGSIWNNNSMTIQKPFKSQNSNKLKQILLYLYLCLRTSIRRLTQHEFVSGS